jgi:hypothetical protein
MLKPGDRVELCDGLRWPGIVMAIFTNSSGEKHVVVEFTAPDVAGVIRIHSPEELCLASSAVAESTVSGER